MTAQEAQAQADAYRAAAADYERDGDDFVAEALRDLANRIGAHLRARLGK